MPRIGMRRLSLAVAAITLAATSGLAAATTAHAATNDDLSLLVLPDNGETAIYNFINTATSSIDVTIYELNDVTMENELVAKEKAGVTVRVILDQAQKSYDTAAYNVLTAGGVGVVWSSTSFTYTHQKTITVNNDESYISTGNFDNTYYATSRDYGVFDTDINDVNAIVAVFNADYKHTSITPSDGDDLVWSPTDSQTQLLALINGATHTLDIEQEEFSDTTLVNAIVAREKAGVTVRVVVEDPSSYTSELNEVTAAGGTVTGYSSSTGFYIHAKTVIADYGYSDEKAFVGSENFSSGSLNDNRELGIITTDSTIVSGLESTFTGDFSGSDNGKVSIFSPGNQTTPTGTAVYLQTQGEDTCTGTLTYKATGLPTGLSINSTTGVISGTASTAGTYTVTVTGTDSTGPSSSATYTWTVGSTAGNTVTVTNPGNQTGTVGTGVSLQISATDSQSGATLTYSATGLPAGLTLNTTTGLINGTPTTAGDNNVTVTATDNTGAKGSASFTWDISAATGNTVTVTNPGNQTGTVGTGVSLQISATDSQSGATLTYSATGLPAGLTLNTTTGLINGTPTTAGDNNVTVTATDNTGAKGSASFTWDISAATGNTVTVTNPGNQTGTVGTGVSLQISATDSQSGATLTYSATGLPAGLTLNTTTGLINGTPTTAGDNNVTVTATDNTGAKGSASFTWDISSGSSCTAAQLLGNPGFETGTAAPWTASSGVISDNSEEPPYAGTWDAWLDGYDYAVTDTLSQAVSIPSGCSTYSLSFYLHIDTKETGKTAKDTMTVQILNSSGTVLATLATFSNLNAASGYTQYSYNVAAYAGQNVTLKFTGKQVSSTKTSFVLDNTAINVS